MTAPSSGKPIRFTLLPGTIWDLADELPVLELELRTLVFSLSSVAYFAWFQWRAVCSGGQEILGAEAPNEVQTRCVS